MDTKDVWNDEGQVASEVMISRIRGWHRDRNLIEGSTDKDQFCKLIQECGELSDNMCKNKDMRDDIGDIMVVLINIMERNNYTLSECLEQAWGDIKNRKGKMIDGIFVKESDL
jgi:hypothetical protein|tara:strand:- start:81 stop:419 length:339 start_codon:yes stop_codon:yes gene_type:complete